MEHCNINTKYINHNIYKIHDESYISNKNHIKHLNRSTLGSNEAFTNLGLGPEHWKPSQSCFRSICFSPNELHRTAGVKHIKCVIDLLQVDCFLVHLKFVFLFDNGLDADSPPGDTAPAQTSWTVQITKPKAHVTDVK